LTYLSHGELPEVLTLILHPGGRKQVSGVAEMTSPQGWTRLHLEWKAIEMWTIPAAELLAADDLGLIPWIPLTKIDGPPEPVFRECRARIDRDAPPGDRENLLAVSQFLARLNYNDPGLFEILGGQKVMIESPMLKELIADTTRKANRAAIIRVLAGRFGRQARALRTALKAIEDDKKLEKLQGESGRCPDLEAFRKLLEP
jgi:hypothetical protein